jgi:hypothetical protein
VHSAIPAPLETLLAQKGGFQNKCIIYAHVSQLFHFTAGLLKNDGVILYFQIKTNLLQFDASHITIFATLRVERVERNKR